LQAFGIFQRRYTTIFDACEAIISCVGRQSVSGLLFTVAIVFVVLPACVLLGNKLLGLARSRIRLDLAELQRVDTRDPILFLRSFRDDQVSLLEGHPHIVQRPMNLGQPHEFLDHVLLEQATVYGPVVAVGNPQDELPPFGAARGYFSEMTWHQAVEQLSAKARAIVVCLDNTAGIRWEMSHLISSSQTQKCLFFVHPKLHETASGYAVLSELFAKLIQTGFMDETVANEIRLSFESRHPIGLFARDNQIMTALSKEPRQPCYLVVLRRFLREVCASL
jgi:hypothetical protein